MLWGGRFASGPHPDMFRLTASIETDIRLLPFDLEATRAHARVLSERDLLSAADVAAIDTACEEILASYEKDQLELHPRDEDVHSLVERELTERLGDVGARIHAGRSRNDLVAADLRLWTRSQSDLVLHAMAGVLDAIAARAEDHVDTVMPGYTHLQRAQPVTVAYHLLAHGAALARDVVRFEAARSAASESVLGAGALAGNTLGLDPQVAATELGAESVFDNAMDAIAQRDFVCDFVYASALCEVHLSRLAEEIVLWTSAEFGFADLSDEWSTGSSMMPQKRNPDLAELLRGRASHAIGDLTTLLTLLKGLPLAYDRDLQEDKGPLFRTGDRILAALEAAAALVGALRFDAERLSQAAQGGGSWATDLAEALVARGVPFREAHEAAGRLVARLEKQGTELREADDSLLSEIHPKLLPEDRNLDDPHASVERRSGHGGPSSADAGRQIAKLRDISHRIS